MKMGIEVEVGNSNCISGEIHKSNFDLANESAVEQNGGLNDAADCINSINPSDVMESDNPVEMSDLDTAKEILTFSTAAREETSTVCSLDSFNSNDGVPNNDNSLEVTDLDILIGQLSSPSSEGNASTSNYLDSFNISDDMESYDSAIEANDLDVPQEHQISGSVAKEGTSISICLNPLNPADYKETYDKLQKVNDLDVQQEPIILASKAEKDTTCALPLEIQITTDDTPNVYVAPASNLQLDEGDDKSNDINVADKMECFNGFTDYSIENSTSTLVGAATVAEKITSKILKKKKTINEIEEKPENRKINEPAGTSKDIDVIANKVKGNGKDWELTDENETEKSVTENRKELAQKKKRKRSSMNKLDEEFDRLTDGSCKKSCGEGEIPKTDNSDNVHYKNIFKNGEIQNNYDSAKFKNLLKDKITGKFSLAQLEKIVTDMICENIVIRSEMSELMKKLKRWKITEADLKNKLNEYRSLIWRVGRHVGIKEGLESSKKDFCVQVNPKDISASRIMSSESNKTTRTDNLTTAPKQSSAESNKTTSKNNLTAASEQSSTKSNKTPPTNNLTKTKKLEPTARKRTSAPKSTIDHIQRGNTSTSNEQKDGDRQGHLSKQLEKPLPFLSNKTHPAPKPPQPPMRVIPGCLELPPPVPFLTLSHTTNGIVLQWRIHLSYEHASIENYELYGYDQMKFPNDTSYHVWKKMSDIIPLPPPMACTVTECKKGHIYHFMLRAVDSHSRAGGFSEIRSIMAP